MILIVMKTIFISFIFLFCSATNAFAYLDPVSGGVILQMIIAGITGAIAYVVFYYKKVKDFLNKVFKKKEKKN